MPRRRKRRATHDGNFMHSPLMLKVLARREADQLIQDAIDREASFWTQMHGAFSAAANAAAAVASKVAAASQLESEPKEEASVVMVEVAQLEGVVEEEEEEEEVPKTPLERKDSRRSNCIGSARQEVAAELEAAHPRGT